MNDEISYRVFCGFFSGKEVPIATRVFNVVRRHAFNTKRICNGNPYLEVFEEVYDEFRGKFTGAETSVVSDFHGISVKSLGLLERFLVEQGFVVEPVLQKFQ